MAIIKKCSLKKDSCAFDKFAIDHEATINYDTSSMKTLEQFTLCLWMRFTKHDGDHVLFTYAGELIIIALQHHHIGSIVSELLPTYSPNKCDYYVKLSQITIFFLLARSFPTPMQPLLNFFFDENIDFLSFLNWASVETFLLLLTFWQNYYFSLNYNISLKYEFIKVSRALNEWKNN